MQLNTDRHALAVPCSAIPNLGHPCPRGQVDALVLDCSLAAAAAAEVWGRGALSVSTHTCTADVYGTSPSPSIKSTICRGSTPTHTLIHVHVPHWSPSFGMIAFKTGCTRKEGEETASYIHMHLLQREASSMYGCTHVCMYAGAFYSETSGEMSKRMKLCPLPALYHFFVCLTRRSPSVYMHFNA